MPKRTNRHDRARAKRLAYEAEREAERAFAVLARDPVRYAHFSEVASWPLDSDLSAITAQACAPALTKLIFESSPLFARLTAKP